MVDTMVETVAETMMDTMVDAMVDATVEDPLPRKLCFFFHINKCYLPVITARVRSGRHERTHNTHTPRATYTPESGGRSTANHFPRLKV